MPLETVPMPRSQSAMGSLQPSAASSSSPSKQPYRPFIPPSAYVPQPSSSASSPGVGSMGQIVSSNVANHISSAFARGLNGVNGVVNGTAPVRIPQSASNVANAVWNKLPPALQMLKDENWDVGSVPGTNGFASQYQEQGVPRVAPTNMRSHSLGAIGTGSENERNKGGNLINSEITFAPTNAFEGTSPPQPLQPAHAPAFPLAAQLRLEVANKQMTQQPSLHRGESLPSTTALNNPAKQKAPYKPGYRPKNGVSRLRTDEFLKLRNAKNGLVGARKSSNDFDAGIAKATLAEERLLRRLDKIIELHFPNSLSGGTRPNLPESSSNTSLAESITASPRKQTGFRRSSDVFGKVLKGVSTFASGNETRCKLTIIANFTSCSPITRVLAAADQIVVKWQNDGEALRCPICLFACSFQI